MPRRDQAHRAGGADHRHHPRDPGDVDPAGGARAREHDRVHARRRAPRDRRSRSRRPTTAARAARRRRRASTSGPTTGSCCRQRAARGIDEAHELANPEYALDSISRTFHGRDLFAPAAAHLANGVPLGELGPPVDPEGLVRLDLPEPAVVRRRDHATLLYVDSFGNIALNLDRDDVEALGIVSGHAGRARALRASATTRSMARTFADARPGDVILYEDSYKNMSLAISRGSAARMLHASPGQEIRISDRELT